MRLGLQELGIKNGVLCLLFLHPQTSGLAFEALKRREQVTRMIHRIVIKSSNYFMLQFSKGTLLTIIGS